MLSGRGKTVLRAAKIFTLPRHSPLFDNAPFAECGMPELDGRASLWAQDAEGALAMKAEAVMHSA